jgi:hypothetical protein
MGGEAADTHTAIGRMPSELSRALVAYYTGRGQLADRVRLFNKGRRGQARVGERTFQRRVDEARDAFWQLWLECVATPTRWAPRTARHSRCRSDRLRPWLLRASGPRAAPCAGSRRADDCSPFSNERIENGE